MAKAYIFMVAEIGVQCHTINVFRPTMIEIDMQGELLKIKLPAKYPMLSAAPASKRGVIQGFSAKSRKRLLELFARFDRRKHHESPHKALFITLTYKENMTDAKRGKRNLRAFIRRLERHADNVWGVWRQEQQERGAYHYHLIVGNLPYTNVQELQTWWCEISGETVRNSLDLEVIRSYQGVMFYAAKYVSKPEKSGERSMGLSVCHNGTQPFTEGRQWGTFNRAGMPLAKRIKGHAVVTLRTLIEWTASVESDYANWSQGFTIMSERAKEWLKLLTDIAAKRKDENETAYLQWKWSQQWVFGVERSEARERYAEQAQKSWGEKQWEIHGFTSMA